MLSLTNLIVEARKAPLAVETALPRFSWNLSSDRRGCMQAAYRLVVTGPEGVVWDTSRVASSTSIGVQYAGTALRPETKYTWQVTCWDDAGETASESSYFETAPASFGAAKWIGSDCLNLSAHSMSVFRLDWTVEIPKDSSRAGICFGGNDQRLADKNKNIMGAESAPNSSFIRLVLDVGATDQGKPAKFIAYRHGYVPGEDGSKPLYTAEIPENLINQQNAHGPHSFRMMCVYGEIKVYVDGSDTCITEGERRGPFPPSGWNLNPAGQGGNYTCFPLLCDIGAYVEPGERAVLSGFAVKNLREPGNTLYAGWPEGEFAGGKEGYLELRDPSHDGMTMLRTEFTAEKPISRARLHATARGIYELSINGHKVGEDWFAPGLSQYNKTHYYQTYDVTEYLRTGANALGAELAEGWWSGAITFSGEKWNFFGDRQSLLLRLMITYEDGTIEEIVSDPDTWQTSTSGPVRYGSFFQGEVYNSLMEMPGWNEPGYDASGWQPAKGIILSRENAFIGDMRSGGPSPSVTRIDYDAFALRPQPDEGVRAVQTLQAQSMTEPRPGVYIYDMGQNMAGVPEIDVTGKAGKPLTLRFAEILYPDMEEYRANAGMLMLENIRGALAQDTIYLKDGMQTVRPRFTFHGYRYIEITGIDAPLPLEAVRGIALSSAKLTADFLTSDSRINRLYQNVVWSLRDNFISIPTDCPQRNERMGWSGDLSVFSRTATYMADADAFLRRHMQAIRDTQSEAGRFDDVAPVGGGFGGTLWGSVGVTAVWEAYRQYGDIDMLREQFPAMCRYMRYLKSRIDPATGIVSEGPLGDWLGPENEKNEPAFLWQCYYVYDLDIVLSSAKLLGDQASMREFKSDREAAWTVLRNSFFDPDTLETVFSSENAAKGLGSDGRPAPFSHGNKPLPAATASGRYLMDTETSYAVPLALNILDADTANKAGEYLMRAVERENVDDLGITRPPYSLMTGFIGTALICPALSQAGSDTDAWRLLKQRSYPSWLYPVDQGATTIWERLDSFTWERGFGGNNSMNSFNHYSFGAVAYWMLSRALGVARTETLGVWALEPTPDPDGEVTCAEGRVETPIGTFESAWTVESDATTYSVTVPANTSAVLRIPAESEDVILEGILPAGQAEGVQALGVENGRAAFRLGSGKYAFTVKKNG